MQKAILHFGGIVLLFFVWLNVFSCIESEAEKKERELQSRDELVFIRTICMSGVDTLSEETTYEDRKNGIIKTTIVKEYTRECEPVYTKTSVIYFKKCLQGQIYREVENDCRGTGSAEDNWGAVKYQFCPTNDDACDLEGEGVADPAKSPAAIACAEDTTTGKEWRLVGRSVYALEKFFPATVMAIVLDVPTRETARIWKEFVDDEDTTKALTYTLESDGSIWVLEQLKNTNQYVLCATEWETTTR